MLKTKSKFKLLLALGIMLLAMLLLGTTKVNATSSILSNIPDSIEVNIPSTQYDKLYYDEDLLNTIKSYITEDITDYTISRQFTTISNGILTDVSQMEIKLLKNYETVETKKVYIVYNDNSKRNDTDKNYVQNIVKNLDFNINFEYEFNADTDKEFEDLNIQLEKLFANTGLEYIRTEMAQGEPTVCGNEFDNQIIITRNGVAYLSAHCKFKGNMVIIVPANIEDTDKAIIDYSSQKLKERMKNMDGEENEINSLTITKGTEQDKYIVNYTLWGDDWTETIIIRKLKQENTNVNVTDKTTNIKLETNDNVVPVNTILNAKEIKEEKTLNVVKESLKDISSKYTTYDITLTSNGVAIQPNGKVKISIPIPTDYDKTKLAIYRVADNGDKTKYDVKVEGNFATIETDHFSTYVLAENNVTISDTNTNNQEKDNTPKTGKLDIINYVLVVTALAGIGILTFKKY